MVKKTYKETGGLFWKKLEEAKEKGITVEEFEQIEGIEAYIAELQNKIDECKKEIKIIKKSAEKRLMDV